METITIKVYRADVYEEVAKVTDYTGSKLIDGDAKARDRILAADADLATLDRFWTESAMACNENFKEMLVVCSTDAIRTPNGQHEDTGFTEYIPPGQGTTPTYKTEKGYQAEIEVSKSFDKTLTESVESTIRSYFIASIVGQWFKFANKGEAGDYFAQAAEMLEGAERMLYSRRKPTRPTD